MNQIEASGTEANHFFVLHPDSPNPLYETRVSVFRTKMALGLIYCLIFLCVDFVVFYGLNLSWNMLIYFWWSVPMAVFLLFLPSNGGVGAFIAAYAFSLAYKYFALYLFLLLEWIGDGESMSLLAFIRYRQYLFILKHRREAEDLAEIIFDPDMMVLGDALSQVL